MRALNSVVMAGIPNHFNEYRSTIVVRLYEDDLHHFVVIREPDGNPGPSITNCAETACPYIQAQLGLDWGRCIFIESYPPGHGDLDPSFDQICFEGEPRELVIWRGNVSERIREARFARPGWRPLSRDLAMALHQAGCETSALIGRRVRLAPNNKWVTVAAYDGRNYYAVEGDVFAATVITGIKQEEVS